MFGPLCRNCIEWKGCGIVVIPWSLIRYQTVGVVNSTNAMPFDVCRQCRSAGGLITTRCVVSIQAEGRVFTDMGFLLQAERTIGLANAGKSQVRSHTVY